MPDCAKTVARYGRIPLSCWMMCGRKVGAVCHIPELVLYVEDLVREVSNFVSQHSLRFVLCLARYILQRPVSVLTAPPTARP